ncbi:MAG: restriction endonuclease [Lachnospiraceae bacterium]|nr:restriction endonuclease [Lachnospiraceae bacterium]
MIDVILVIIIIILAVLLFLAFRRGRRMEYDPYEEMEGRDFEYYCADLLKERGFLQVEVTKGSRDFGADILAEKDGVSYAIQCKRYDGPVGVHAVQEAYAGRDYYGCMVGAVMTNQYFTEPAVELATKLKIMLWDRDYIGED